MAGLPVAIGVVGVGHGGVCRWVVEQGRSLGHDALALGAYRALKEHGLKIPSDVAVVGVGDYEISPFFDPPLTTVELPYNAMGVRAGERLLALISGEGRNDPEPVLVAGPVHWRASIQEVRKPNLVTFKTLREEKG